MLALRYQLFDRIDTLFRRLQHQATLGLVVLAELDTTVDLGNDRMVLRTPGLEQFGDTRQTAGDVTRLGAFHRSEEHTSELQSLMRNSYAVFCLKKKNTAHTTHISTRFFTVQTNNHK